MKSAWFPLRLPLGTFLTVWLVDSAWVFDVDLDYARGEGAEFSPLETLVNSAAGPVCRLLALPISAFEYSPQWVIFVSPGFWVLALYSIVLGLGFSVLWDWVGRRGAPWKWARWGGVIVLAGSALALRAKGFEYEGAHTLALESLLRVAIPIVLLAFVFSSLCVYVPLALHTRSGERRLY